MKTTFNIVIMLLSALFIVPKAINKTKVREASTEQIFYYFEPEEISRKKMDIELIKGDIRILISKIELEKTQSDIASYRLSQTTPKKSKK